MIKRTFYALTLLLILCVSGIQAQNTKFSKEEFRNQIGRASCRERV